MMKMRAYYTFILLLLLLSCRREEAPQSGPVGFAVMESIPDFETKAPAAWSMQAGDYTLTVSEQWLPLSGADTKASKIYRSADSTPLQGDPIAVWAYNMPAAGSAVSAWLVDGGSPSPVQASYSSGKWVSSVSFNTSKRAASYYTRWFAVAPWAAIGGGATVSTLADGQAPVLSYTVPSAVSGQHDLMVATPTATRAIDDKSDIPLSFQHVLTGIRIKAPKAASVTAVTLSGVYDRATLSLNASELEWTSLTKSSATPSFTADVSSASVWDTSDTEYQILKEGGIFLMLPQWLPEGAKIAITVDGSTVEADLSGHEWKMGKLVTYRVARETREYHIEVEEVYPASVAMDCGVPVPVARINSYTTPAGGGARTPGYWRAVGKYQTKAQAEAGPQNGEYPFWGNAWPESSPNGALPGEGSENLIASFQSYEGTTPTGPVYTVNNVLQSRSQRGTESEPWNLANPYGGGDAIVETANTYLINAPGYYRIPLVLGNGIKGGAANPGAYSGGFVDYSNAGIQNPFLHKTSASAGTPTAGEVVWTETTGMVENLTVVSDAENDLYWLKFRIQSSNIAQGCTVVSVKDGSGTVMWSWLLWATDYEPGAGDVSAGNASFMPRNLGWTVDGNVGTSYGTDAWIRVEALDADGEYAGAYAVVFVHMPNDVDNTGHTGHGPFFQWGRKDAFPPPGTTPTPGYDNTAGKTPADFIKNPLIHYGETAFPYRQTGYLNATWWSALAPGTGQDTKTVKTIYDPCPAGYTVPRLNAFNGYNSTSWVSEGGGYDFTFSGGTLFLPLTGRRKPNADYADETKGHYWVAVPHGNGTSRRLIFENGSIVLPSNGNNSSAFHTKAGEHAIRPAVEE